MRLSALVLFLLLSGLGLAACGDRPAEKAPPSSEPDTLAKQLKAKADAGAANIPDEVKAVLQKAGQDLAASGILTQAKNKGDQAPTFNLKGGMGQAVSLEGLLAEGPVVLTFYRGKW